MIFFIADNEITQATYLKNLLERSYADATFLPSPQKAFDRWQTVVTEVETSTSDGEGLVIILDLGLDSSISSVHTGIQEAVGLKTLRPKALFLAFTQYGHLANNFPHYLETFGGLVDKQKLHSFDTAEEQQFYIHQVVSAALRRRAGTKASYIMEDSLGMRIATAAFGGEILDSLICEVAQGWSDIRVA
jgi:hypothetical protein